MGNYFNLENKIMPAPKRSIENQPTNQTILASFIQPATDTLRYIKNKHFPVSGRWTCWQELISPKSKMKPFIQCSFMRITGISYSTYFCLTL